MLKVRDLTSRLTQFLSRAVLFWKREPDVAGPVRELCDVFDGGGSDLSTIGKIVVVDEQEYFISFVDFKDEGKRHVTVWENSYSFVNTRPTSKKPLFLKDPAFSYRDLDDTNPKERDVKTSLQSWIKQKFDRPGVVLEDRSLNNG